MAKATPSKALDISVSGWFGVLYLCLKTAQPLPSQMRLLATDTIRRSHQSARMCVACLFAGALLHLCSGGVEKRDAALFFS